MFQRPQQFALSLASLGHQTLYLTPNGLDGVQGIRRVGENCRLVPLSDIQLCCEMLDRFVLVLVSTNPANTTIKKLKLDRDRVLVVYDYMDEMHDDIHPVSDEMRRAHGHWLRTADLVCTTADSLYDRAASIALRPVMRCPNGADVSHFRLKEKPPVPPELASIVGRGKPVIGYFGALAKWFDYELIRRIARERPQWEIVLIGVDYDKSLRESGVKKLPNVHYLGTKPYEVLPHYAAYFDVATVPFLVNDVTQSTSPIKLFEYMAARKPIVATDLRECRKYKPVLIAKTHDEFLAKLSEALRLRSNSEYLEHLDRLSDENSWHRRACNVMDQVEELVAARGWKAAETAIKAQCHAAIR